MFDKFSDRARHVMSLARQETQRVNSEFIGGEHILLAIIQESGGMGAKVLENLNFDLKRIRQEIENLITPSTSPTVTLGQLPFSPRAKRVIELAEEEAYQAAVKVIGTEHLLLGVFVEKEGIAATVLRQLGATEEGLRLKIKEMSARTTVLTDPLSGISRKVCIRLWLFKPLESASAGMTLVVDGSRYELSQIIPIQDVLLHQVALIAQVLGSKVYLVEVLK